MDLERIGLRGSAVAKIDDQGRLKIPAAFRPAFQQREGADVFVTSLTGECVRIYPMPAWLDIEEKLSRSPSQHPSIERFLDEVNYWGQQLELDSQGRVVIAAPLRQSAAIRGDVRVVGRISYVEVWNEERFASKRQRAPWTKEDSLALSQFGI
jgi:MraZ protein